MRRNASATLARGVAAGLVAGAVVALWFLALDLWAGRPLDTPARLGAVLLERPYGGVEATLVVAYSVSHFGVFALLGALAAWFLRVTDLNPGLLVGTVLGLGLLSSVHYSALMLAGVENLDLLPGPHVVGANLTAGLVYMLALHRWTDADVFGLEVLEVRLLRRGVTAGLVGAGAVALWFLVLDAWAGRPFYTPAALGSALLGTGGTAAGVDVTPGSVVFYTVVHLAAFSVAGTAFVTAADQVERTPGLWLVVALSFVVLEAVFVPVAGLLGEWVMGALAWWAVAVGNLLAVGAMGGWVWRTHPALRERVRRKRRAEGA